MLHGAAQPLGCSEPWKVTGAAFGEQTRLEEMFGGIYGDCAGHTALIKKHEVLKCWLS